MPTPPSSTALPSVSPLSPEACLPFSLPEACLPYPHSPPKLGLPHPLSPPQPCLPYPHSPPEARLPHPLPQSIASLPQRLAFCTPSLLQSLAFRTPFLPQSLAFLLFHILPFRTPSLLQRLVFRIYPSSPAPTPIFLTSSLGLPFPLSSRARHGQCARHVRVMSVQRTCIAHATHVHCTRNGCATHVQTCVLHVCQRLPSLPPPFSTKTNKCFGGGAALASTCGGGPRGPEPLEIHVGELQGGRAPLESASEGRNRFRYFLEILGGGCPLESGCGGGPRGRIFGGGSALESAFGGCRVGGTVQRNMLGWIALMGDPGGALGGIWRSIPGECVWVSWGRRGFTECVLLGVFLRKGGESPREVVWGSAPESAFGGILGRRSPPERLFAKSWGVGPPWTALCVFGVLREGGAHSSQKRWLRPQAVFVPIAVWVRSGGLSP